MKIQNAPKPKWKVLTHRRLQTWPSDLTKNNSLLDSPLPEWLREPVVSRLLACPMNTSNMKEHIFSNSPHGGPNHVLINECKSDLACDFLSSPSPPSLFIFPSFFPLQIYEWPSADISRQINQERVLCPTRMELLIILLFAP